MSPTPRLPTELFQLIIDYLHNDKETLEQCTLVSHSWLVASRYHLISTIRISPKNYNTLLRLLHSPHSTLATSVSALVFTMWDLVSPHSSEGYEPADFNDIIDRFPSAKSLKSLGIAFDGLDKLQKKNSNILKLDLSCCLFPSSLQLIHVISLFPSLTTLNCTVCKILDSITASASLFEHPRTLKTLQLDEQSLLVLSPDEQQTSHSNLENVEILDISFGNGAVSELLRDAGDTLRHLTIEYNNTIRSYAALGSTNVGFNLSHNTTLRSLSIGFPRRIPLMRYLPSAILDPSEAPELMRHLLPLLASITSLSLSHLKFMIYMVSADTLGYIDWEGIDHLLYDSHRFSRVWFTVELYPMPSFHTATTAHRLREEQGGRLEAIIYKGLERTARLGRLDVRYPVLLPTALANDSLRSVLDAQFGR